SIACGRNAVTRHERLCEGLAALELCRGAGRTEETLTARGEEVGDPAIERELRTNHGEIDPFARGEVRQRRGVAGINRYRSNRFGAPGIARRADDVRHRTFGIELPGKRMLARAAADN